MVFLQLFLTAKKTTYCKNVQMQSTPRSIRPMKCCWPCFLSPQPCISLHCETTDRGCCVMWCACLRPSFCRYSLCLLADGWWLAIGNILRWFTCLQAITHPSA